MVYNYEAQQAQLGNILFWERFTLIVTHTINQLTKNQSLRHIRAKSWVPPLDFTPSDCHWCKRLHIVYMGTCHLPANGICLNENGEWNADPIEVKRSFVRVSPWLQGMNLALKTVVRKRSPSKVRWRKLKQQVEYHGLELIFNREVQDEDYEMRKGKWQQHFNTKTSNLY